jgi:hypothetical protein
MLLPPGSMLLLPGLRLFPESMLFLPESMLPPSSAGISNVQHAAGRPPSSPGSGFGEKDLIMSAVEKTTRPAENGSWISCHIFTPANARTNANSTIATDLAAAAELSPPPPPPASVIFLLPHAEIEKIGRLILESFFSRAFKKEMMNVETIESMIRLAMNIPKNDRAEKLSGSALARAYPRLWAMICDENVPDEDVWKFVAVMLDQLEKVDRGSIDMEAATRSVGQAVIGRYHSS